MPLIGNLHARNLRGDLLGGVTAAVVARSRPRFWQCRPGARWRDLWALRRHRRRFSCGVVRGTPSQVSGPTGPMSVTVAGGVELGGRRCFHRPECWRAAAVGDATVVLGGALALLGVLRLGRCPLVPYSVVPVHVRLDSSFSCCKSGHFWASGPAVACWHLWKDWLRRLPEPAAIAVES